MAPRKRKAEAEEQGEKAEAEEQAKTHAVAPRVTRGAVRRAVEANPVGPVVKEKKAKVTEKPKGAPKKDKEKQKVVEKEESTDSEDGKEENVDDDGSKKKTIIIEHCKQCNSFKTRALQVKKGLEDGVPAIKVLLNPEKPRRGCFEIREDGGGETFISLLEMKRPFKPMKDLDMAKVIEDIIDKIK